MKIASGIDLGRIAEREVFQRHRQLARLRHDGAVHQHRDDADPPIQGGLDLDPDRVVFLLDAQMRALGRAQPPRPDDGDQHVAVEQGIPDVVAKIGAERDAVDVHEDRAFAKLAGEPILDPPRDGVGIRAAI